MTYNLQELMEKDSYTLGVIIVHFVSLEDL